MAELTHLYILVFPKRSIIKIGKADGIHERIKTLKRWWGEVDYAASYHLSAPSDLVFRLEKSLLFLLSQYAVSFEKGDGRTELFSTAALDVALKHIDLFCSSGAVPNPLTKGVQLPPAPLIAPKRRKESHIKYKNKNAAFVTSVTQSAEKFGRLNRLLIILLRKQNRLAYQYDVLDGHVYFRLRVPSAKAKHEHGTVMQLLSFDVEDFHSWSGINCCSVSYSDEILQYRVRLLPAGENGSQDSMLHYFSRQSEFLLARIPNRSPAATEEIPILDEYRILGEIAALHVH